MHILEHVLSIHSLGFWAQRFLIILVFYLNRSSADLEPCRWPWGNEDMDTSLVDADDAVARRS